MEQFVSNLLDWISANPYWAGLAVFAIAFLESLAIIGLAVPGWLLLVGVGTLIGNGHLNFWLMALSSFSGAVLGQLVSYGVGFYFKDRLHQSAWVGRHQKLLDNAESFVKRHGFASILIGQFIGPIRAVISLIAGLLDMVFKRFISAVVLATLIWAPVYLMPGVVVGAALTFEKQEIWILLGCVVAIASAIWLMGRFLIDAYRARQASTVLASRRKLVFALMPVLLLGVIVFLTQTRYGPLMLELSQKIWQVIS
ncbi:DedA family protein [Kangiella sp. TOML190]|uniref:DedA family protein n=1 Tax=Kangiella sp. TOML190 TaxID=2931351 RepID=UPI00203C5255|nr:DedA family protein [Kangiella sp. TOML190]